MDRLISEQAVIESIEFFQMNPQHFSFVNLIDDIKEIPSAEPKTGHWVKYGISRCGEQHYKCTSCGYYINFGQWGELYTKEFKYCPNCGARMIEPQERSE